MWIVEKYVKYLIGFAIVWFGLGAYRSCTCQKMHGLSMVPTVISEEFLFVNKRHRLPHELQPKELVWFEYAMVESKEEGHLGRIIAMPGERVAIKNGEVLVSGLPIGEEYLKADFAMVQNFPEIIVPRDHYFILCDNRRVVNPPDSRFLGPIPVNAVIGRVKR
jgi:signal peptidase I